MSLGCGSVAGGYGGSMLASPMATWGPSMMPPSPTMMGMPMGGYGLPQMPAMPMWPNGGMGASPSMAFSPGALQIPLPYFPHASMGMPMQSPMPMPMLAPPSPGFYSHTSSAVPTPPESPQIMSTHMSKSVPEIGHALATPVRA